MNRIIFSICFFSLGIFKSVGQTKTETVNWLVSKINKNTKNYKWCGLYCIGRDYLDYSIDASIDTIFVHAGKREYKGVWEDAQGIQQDRFIFTWSIYKIPINAIIKLTGTNDEISVSTLNNVIEEYYTADTKYPNLDHNSSSRLESLTIFKRNSCEEIMKNEEDLFNRLHKAFQVLADYNAQDYQKNKPKETF